MRDETSDSTPHYASEYGKERTRGTSHGHNNGTPEGVLLIITVVPDLDMCSSQWRPARDSVHGAATAIALRPAQRTVGAVVAVADVHAKAFRSMVITHSVAAAVGSAFGTTCRYCD